MSEEWQRLGFLVINLLAIARSYYGLKSDNAKLCADVALAMLTERTTRETSQLTLKTDLLSLITAVEIAVKDLTRRIGTVESGQDEWTKSLRLRTHDLADKLQMLVLKVDRIERVEKDKHQ